MKKIYISLIILLFGMNAYAQNDTILIKKAAMDYIEGAFSGDAERVMKAVHPELQKVIPVEIPTTSNMFFQYTNYSYLIEGTKSGMMKSPKDKWGITYKLLDHNSTIATVLIKTSTFIDYCHLAKINNEWKIINALWVMNKPTNN